MTPQAIADPESLERFAHELKQFSAQMRDGMSRLNGQFANLGETWRDQEHQKFAQEYQQTMRVLQQFTRSADEHIPFLIRKAQSLRDYLTRR